jgi:hypothetical protein
MADTTKRSARKMGRPRNGKRNDANWRQHTVMLNPENDSLIFSTK